MRRGEIWWADNPGPSGRRPVALLSRDDAYFKRELITVASVTTRVRNLPAEVHLGKKEGLERPCVINLDYITTIPISILDERVCLLPPGKIRELDEALIFSLGIKSPVFR